jgi:adenylate cyclase
VPKYTYEDVRNEFVLRHLDLIRVKGKTIPIRIYELMGHKADGRLLEIAGLFEAGLAAYWEQDWVKAEKIFNEVLAKNPGDGPSKAFLSRIESLRKTELPRDWDGVFVMTKK